MVAFKDKVFICRVNYRTLDFNVIKQKETLGFKYASITPRKNGVFITRNGIAAFDKMDVITHDIVVKKDYNMLITTNAYLFRLRKKFPSEWYRVKTIIEDGIFLKLACVLEDYTGDNDLMHNIPDVNKMHIDAVVSPPAYKDFNL